MIVHSTILELRSLLIITIFYTKPETDDFFTPRDSSIFRYSHTDYACVNIDDILHIAIMKMNNNKVLSWLNIILLSFSFPQV